MFDFIIPFIILILVVVFIHEYGHYYFARKYGVGVTDFSIGFGKDVNKTPINLQDFKTVKRNTLVFDIIYKPLKTKFLRLAKKNKAKI